MVIKICGITQKKDRDLCFKYGVDLVGYNIYPGSDRFLELSEIKSLITRDNKDRSVVVGVDLNITGWKAVVELLNPGFIQLHGREKVGFVKKLKQNFSGTYIIKKVTRDDMGNMEEILKYADFILWDSKTKFHGGQGKHFDWTLLNSLDSSIKKRVFVAGGITPDNVKEVASYKTYGLDLASGVENTPGIKDSKKVKKIMTKVKNYDKH